MKEGMMDLLYKQNLESAVRNALRHFQDVKEEEIEDVCGLAGALVDEGIFHHSVGSGEDIDTYHIFLLEYVMGAHLTIIRMAEELERLKTEPCDGV